MTERKIATIVISISLLSIWIILNLSNIIGPKTESALIFLSLAPFIYCSFIYIKDFNITNPYLKFILPIFLLYELTVVARGWSFSYYSLKDYFESGYVFWPFIIPLFIFFDKKIINYFYFIKWIYYASFLFLLMAVIFPSKLMQRPAELVTELAVPCGFMLLNASYLSNRKVNIAFLIVSIAILSLVYTARRSALVTFLGFVSFAYVLNLFNKSKSKIFRYLPLLIIIGAFVVSSSSFNNINRVLVNKIKERMYEDTRTSLFEMFFYDMRANVIFGKGMNGTYYFPLNEAEIDGAVFAAVQYRSSIENGYLQLFLTGGLVQIILFLLVLLPAAFLGIFNSSNQFSQACGGIVFLQLIDMLFFGVPYLSVHYILVWICSGICYTASIRRLTNADIRSEFQKVGLI